MRWLWVLLLFGSLNVAQAAQATCVAESQLSVGDYGRVTPGAANNVREQPNTEAQLVGEIPGGGLFAVIGAAECDDSFVWVEVAYADFTGWTVEANATEYWVEPFEGEIYADAVIQFGYPEGYLDAVVPESVPAQDQMGGFFPARQEYALEFPNNDNPFRWRIIVMRAAEITDEAPHAAESLAKLRALLRDHRDLTGPILELFDPNQPHEGIFLPEDPLFLGARRMLIADAHYVDMQQGQGVAFVTFYAQDLLPVNNEGIFYNYLALTDDGEYFVTMRLPIGAAILPDTYEDFEFPNVDSFGVPVGWAENYGGYRTQTTNELDALAPDDWEPSMDTVDSIVSSILVVGDFKDTDEG